MSNTKGYTIIELLVGISIGVVISSVMVVVMIVFYGNTIRSQVQAEMAVDSYFALRTIVEDVRLSSNVLSTNTLIDDNEPVGGWLTDETLGTIIVSKPATRTNESVIYNDATGDPYYNEIIYYLEDGLLNRRTLKDDAAADNAATTTCPEEVASSLCPADRQLAEYATSFSFVLLDTNNAVTNDPSLARSVRLTLSMEKPVFGRPVTASNTIVTELRN